MPVMYNNYTYHGKQQSLDAPNYEKNWCAVSVLELPETFLLVSVTDGVASFQI